MAGTEKRPLYNFYRRYLWSESDFNAEQATLVGMLRDTMGSAFGAALLSGGAVTAGTGLAVNVAAYIANGPDGYLHVRNSTVSNVPVTANSSGNSRKDLVVARPLIADNTTIVRPTNPFDNVPLIELQDTQVVVIPGTPSATPVYPSAGATDVILAGITVTNGASAPSSFDTSVTNFLNLPANKPFFNQEWFGDGSDGNATITTNNATVGTWLTSGVMQRDAYLANLTINSSGAIQTNGYRLFVSGVLDISSTLSQAITDSTVSGRRGGNGTVGAAGAGAAAVASQTVGGGGSGGTSGTNTAGSAGSAGTAGANGGNGGAGGTASGGGGAAGGAGGAATNPASLRFPTLNLLRGATLITGGGGGGGGGSRNTYGGGGGAAAGTVFIAANTINRSTGGTGGGVISAVGGSGGNGFSGAGDDGGGGGGGAGGWVFLIYGALTGTAAGAALAATGGTGGNGGTGGGIGTGGTGGDGGRITVIQVGVSVSESLGTTGSGPSGSIGGSPGTLTVNL